MSSSSSIEKQNKQEMSDSPKEAAVVMTENKTDPSYQSQLESNPVQETTVSNQQSEDRNIETETSNLPPQEENINKQQTQPVESAKEATPVETQPLANADERITRKSARQAEASAVKNTCSNTENKYVPGSLDEYRHRVLHLERMYLTKIYEAERAKLYHAQVAKINYEYDCQQAEEEFELGRRLLITRLLYENADRRKRIEELKYKIVRDENSSFLRLRKYDSGHRTRSTHQPFHNDSHKNSSGKETVNGEEGILFSTLQHCADQDSHLSQLAATSRWNRLVRGTRRATEEKNQLRVVLDSDEMKEDLAEISATPRKGPGINSADDKKYKAAEEEKPLYQFRGRKRKGRGKGRVVSGRNR